jgi:hypothetical protein
MKLSHRKKVYYLILQHIFSSFPNSLIGNPWFSIRSGFRVKPGMTAKSPCFTVFIEKFSVALIAIIFSIISLSLFSCGGGGDGGSTSSSNTHNNPPSGTTATLTWDAPTTNADGTPLTDLAGYRIYYGTTSGN